MGPNETENANLKSYLAVADDWEKKSHTEKRGKKKQKTPHTAKRKQFQDYSQLFSHL